MWSLRLIGVVACSLRYGKLEKDLKSWEDIEPRCPRQYLSTVTAWFVIAADKYARIRRADPCGTHISQVWMRRREGGDASRLSAKVSDLAVDEFSVVGVV